MNPRIDYRKLTAHTAAALREVQESGGASPLAVMVRFVSGGVLGEIRHTLEAAGLRVSLLLPKGICSGEILPQNIARLTDLDFVQKIDLPKMTRVR